MNYKEMLVAEIPEKFYGYNDTTVYSKKPTFPKNNSPFLGHLDTYAGLDIKTSFHDTDWTNWEETTYNWEFETSAAYHPNAFRQPLTDEKGNTTGKWGEVIPPDLKPEDLPKVYQLFVDNFCDSLIKKLGKVFIDKKMKAPQERSWDEGKKWKLLKAYFIEDSNQYLTLSKFTETYKEKIIKFKLFADFSKVVTSEKGMRRAKLSDQGTSVHKTGTKVTIEDFIQVVHNELASAYQIIVENRFDECLQGKA